MATRFYLPASGAAAVTVTPDAGWTVTTSYGSYVGPTAKSDTALTDGTARSKGSATNPSTRLDRQYVSAPILGGSISGTFSAVIRGLESSASYNSWLNIVIRVVSNDGGTVRGTLYAGSPASTQSATASNENGEWGTSAATRIKNGLSLSSVTAQDGDRIVIEVGVKGATTTTTYTSTLRYGDPTATNDFALTAALTTDLCPWVELSQTLVFGTGLTQTDTSGITDGAVVVAYIGVRTESTGLTDSVTHTKFAAGYSEAATDSAGSTDGTGLAIAWNTTDNVVPTDALAGRALDKAVTDVAGLADSTSLGATVTDATGTTDSVTAPLAIGRTVTDEAGATDAVTLSGMSRSLTVDDLAGVTEAAPRIAYAGAHTSGAGLVDSATPVKGGAPQALTQGVDDAAGLTDPVTTVGVYLRTVDDAAAPSDSLGGSTAMARTDSAGATDAGVAYGRMATTTSVAGLTDSVNTQRVQDVTATDSAGATDADGALWLEDAVDDTTGLTDTATTALTVPSNSYSVTQNDGAGSTDAAVPFAPRTTPTDDAGVRDQAAPVAAFAQQTTDLAGVSDTASTTLSGTGTEVNSVYSDTSGPTDNVALILSYARTIDDVSGLVDTADPVPGIRLVAAFDDTAGLSDPPVTAVGMERAWLDVVGLTDTLTIGLGTAVHVERELTDPLELTDAAVVIHGQRKLGRARVGAVRTWVTVGHVTS